mgnify:CR=1 FL=1
MKLNNLETIIFILIIIGLVAYIALCGYNVIHNLEELGYLAMLPAGRLTSKGHDFASRLLWVDDLTRGDVTPDIPSGYVRVNGRVDMVPEYRRGRVVGMREVLICITGEFETWMKSLDSRGVRWSGRLEPDFEQGYVDVPMWLGIRWGLCDQYGNLCYASVPVIHPQYGKLTKQLQATMSNSSPF